ncbi:MAG: DEAD/DEAH box helicase [Rhodoferax sp.]|nr:DEAD/DEAH box helicase [Rhodoferax sp.]
MTFSSMGLSPELLAAVDAQGHSSPTPIQRACIAAALAGRDIVGKAPTGSGKTLAFALPLLQRLNGSVARQRGPQALVLAPTRELAVQIGDTMRELARHLTQPTKISVVFGGVSINPQLMGLRGGTDVVIATPGRLLDLIAHHALSLANVALLVLDEADRLLDLGFSQELGDVLAQLPTRRQNLFFSATFGQAVHALVDQLLLDPIRVGVDAAELAPIEIEQRAYAVDAGQRAALLRHLMAQHGWSRVLVFVASKYAAEMVADKMRRAGLSAEPFHGALSQGKRTQVLTDFKASRLTMVVATDLAGRGLDIADLPVVVNYDLPRSPQDYTHRVGRTGRAGVPGLAISFVSATTQTHFALIQKRLRLALVLAQVPGFEAKPATSTPKAGTVTSDGGGIKGRRISKKDKARALRSGLSVVNSGGIT